MQVGVNEAATITVFEQLSALVRPRALIDESPELLLVREAITKLNYTPEALMMDLMQPCNQLTRQCLWLNQKIPCEDLFYVSKSSEGFCCSFNYKGSIHLNRY